MAIKYSVRYDHIELSAWDQEQVEKKLGRLDKRVQDPHMLDITFAHSTHHLNGPVVECKLTLEQGKKVFYAAREAESVQSSLDRSLEALLAELEHTYGKRAALEKGHRA